MSTLRLGETISDHKRTGTAAELPSGELTTHGVIVGMTGSGKTGLAMVLIEEVLSSGVPVILIDPKGDLANLCLLFPGLTPAEFEPWVDPADAAKAGIDTGAFAAQQAKGWSEGLASWGLGTEQITKLGAGARFTVYTPGSSAGVGLNIVGSLQAPVGADAEDTADEVEGFVTGLLGLVGVDADPLASREHILLSNLIATAWGKGQDLDLPTLVAQVQTPPLRKLGVFDLDTFFPPKDRTALALKLNGLLASPSFAAWGAGVPLDIDTMLHADGKPRAAIVSIAHLSDSERQFVVSLLLGKLITWMRRQSGTGDLRALVYMDEVAGYVPPTAMPPSKKPMLTLFKQGRAFGVGMVLATQNPVDVDYKAISNAGTWLIGRLQTEQDKARIIDGLSSSTGGVDTAQLSDQIGALSKREFVMRRASQSAPTLITSRWSMSYLRGPLTKDQIATLMADQKAAMPAAQSAPTVAPTAVATGEAAPPGALAPTAAGVEVRYVDAAAPWASQFGAITPASRFEAAAVCRVQLLYDDDAADLRENVEYEAVLHPLSASFDAAHLVAVDYDDRDLRTDVPGGATYVDPDAPVGDKKYWDQLAKDLVDHLVRNRTMDVRTNKDLKMFSRPGETEESFKNRCDEAADALADAEMAKLRDKYEPRHQKLAAALTDADNRVDIAKSEKKAKRSNALLSAAGSLLGAFLGGRRSSKSLANKVLRGAGTVTGRTGQAATAGKRVDAAEDKVDAKQAELDALEAELDEDLTQIRTKWEQVAATIATARIPLEKTDVKVSQVVLAWIGKSA
jgi:hypothetical protein